MDFMISEFCQENVTQVLHTSRNREHSGLMAEDDGQILERLPPEMELGNVEYKAKLVNPSSSRLQHLITQMKWRLREGQGEAIYEVGVEDNGAVSGLTDEEMAASLHTLKSMANAIDASVVVVTERDVTPRGSSIRRSAVEVLVRRVPENQQFIELRLAILGGCDVGKSTMCGVLTQGGFDDGHGSKRQNLFRYLHELNSGKTSSICLDVIGFDARGKLVNYARNSLEEVVEKSTKLVTLIDLAGDIKYLGTTIQGLSGYNPHYSCLLISAETGPTAATREHLGLARALSIPVFVILTKKDCVDKQQLDTVYQQILKLMGRAGIHEGLKRVKTKRDAVRACTEMTVKRIVPVLSISCVTGEGHKVLRTFLNCLPANIVNDAKMNELANREALFTIEEVYQVAHVGTVACGMLSEGRVTEGDKVVIGPTKNGNFHLAEITSIRRSRQPVRTILPGQAASIAVRFGGMEIPLRRGMILQSPLNCAKACLRFSANILLLYHTTSEICIGFQATVYIGSVCQTVKLLDVENTSLVPGQWTIARFEFLNNSEALRVGTPLILRQGRTKGMGEITEVHYI
ncbi:unnamed protein product, partial [Mesorhabditis belari]|uniref:GTP-binding protein 2 n=1 Tax=Mesorhabditis belari TaxID=2138241 RepID=A0AAF3JC28_9BILA